MPWSTDEELFRLMRDELFTAVVGDSMDAMGHVKQFLPQRIQPLREDMVVVGRAMPVLETDDIGGESAGRSGKDLGQPFGLMLDALDDLQPGEVYICSGASPEYALWGELMSQCARNRGAAGAVVDGFSRDTRGILEQNFPVFSYGRYAQDQRPRGKVIDYRCRIRIGQVEVSPGDLVFGDWEGVCIIPRTAEVEVIEAALEKARGEKQVLEAIRKGCGAREAWDRYGIL